MDLEAPVMIAHAQRLPTVLLSVLVLTLCLLNSSGGACAIHRLGMPWFTAFEVAWATGRALRSSLT